MDEITYSEARSKLKEVMDKVVEQGEPMLITRRQLEPVVMISKAKYSRMLINSKNTSDK